MNIIRTQYLKKYYGDNLNFTKALDDINITIEQGKFVFILGKSGSGKSMGRRVICNFNYYIFTNNR